MRSGETFVLNSKNVEGGHPRIVISDPHDGRVIVVSVTEWAANKDQSCVLEAGVERIIKKRSLVSYRDAAIVPVSSLDDWIESGAIIQTDPVSAETVQRILYGCGLTNRIRQGPYDFLDQLGLIPVV